MIHVEIGYRKYDNYGTNLAHHEYLCPQHSDVVLRETLKYAWGSAGQKARITWSQRCIFLVLLQQFLLVSSSVYYFRNKVYSNDEWFIDNVIPLTSSLCIARIVHYILYIIKATVRSDIQSILRAVRTSTFIMYIIKSFDNFVIHTLAYIISQSSAIFRQISIFIECCVLQKNIFQVPPMINIGKSLYVFMYLTSAIPFCLWQAFIRPSESFIANRP